jgi:hypothetical protein
MDKLKKLLRSFQNLNQWELLESLLKEKELRNYILDLNRIDQLFNQGIDSKGQSLGEYAASTILGTSKFKGKIEKGQPTDRVTLKDTGDFYKSFDILFEDDGFEITADENIDYVPKLLDTYGEDILGLTTESLQEAILVIRGAIIRKIEDKIALLLNG